MTPASANLPRRYPGLKPFERAQSAVFYGRGEDVQRFVNLAVRERLVVLFAKSGIGKTSLLQAGVAPEWEKQGLIPIFLRADKTNASLVDTIGEALEKHPSVGGRDNTGEIAGDRVTLWERMKRLEFDLDGLPATPVLVLDQFEEVFTLGHSETSRRRFLGELADLANEVMPDSIRATLMQRLQRNDPALSPAVMQWWERQPDLRLVISIRSDFLHLLDEISPLIPNILRNRYQLQPLDRRQAQAAIEEPARAPGVFASPVFGFHAGALTEMLDFLAGRQSDEGADDGEVHFALRKRDEIESFNLQILCQYVEEKIIDERHPAAFEVTPAFYEGHEGLEREIRDFYHKQLQALPDIYTRRTAKNVAERAAFIGKAQNLIEESLVTPIGRRCSMVDDFLTSTWQVDHDFLDTLVETRLLRKELRLDDFYYEISHDTLLPAIIESRDVRRRREKADQENAELQARLAEEAKQRQAMEVELKAMVERRKMARRVTLFSLTTAILMLLFTILYVYNWVQAARKELEQAEFVVSNEAFRAGVESYQNLINQPVKSALLRHLTGRNVHTEVLKVQRLQGLYDTIVTENMLRGDSLFFQHDAYSPALTKYREAYQTMHAYAKLNDVVRITKGDTVWRIQPQNIKVRYEDLYQRRRFALNAIIAQFKIRQRAAEEFADAGVWGQALRIFREMEALLPQDPEDLQTLQDAMHLNENPRTYIGAEIKRSLAGLKY